MELVPGVFVASSPWARLPNSLPKAHSQVWFNSGLETSFLYFVIDLPVTGWVTGAQKWSHMHGMSEAVYGGIIYVFSAT